MMSKDYAILVNSCDAYEDLWEPFFLVLKDRWNLENCDIVLNTETKAFRMDGLNIRTLNLGTENKDYQWGGRLIETLKHIETKYVLSLFDDFILENDVNVDKMEQCIRWMDENEQIAVFYLMNIPQPNEKNTTYEGFDLVPNGQDYRLNSAPAIWRRERLMSYTKKVDSPWGWEYFGSVRTFRTDDLFYCVAKDAAPIYCYSQKLGGAVHRGKWVKSVIEPVVQKYQLSLDLSKRGFEDEEGNATKHSFKTKLRFFALGYRMIGFEAVTMLFRYIKIKLKRLVK